MNEAQCHLDFWWSALESFTSIDLYFSQQRSAKNKYLLQRQICIFLRFPDFYIYPWNDVIYNHLFSCNSRGYIKVYIRDNVNSCQNLRQSDINAAINDNLLPRWRFRRAEFLISKLSTIVTSYQTPSRQDVRIFAVCVPICIQKRSCTIGIIITE